MPLYEYKCKKCGHKFERLLKSYNETVKECPICGGEVERLISTSAVQFKGSGFYSTDYGAKSPAKSASAEAPAASTASSPTEKAAPAEKGSPAKTETASTSTPASKPATGS